MVERLSFFQVCLLLCALSFALTNAFQHGGANRLSSSRHLHHPAIKTINQISRKSLSLLSTTTDEQENSTSFKTDSIIKQDINQQDNNKILFTQGIKNLLSGKGWKGKEFLTKESLAKLGLNVLLAYGFVSNFSYVTCVIISWVAHGRKYGKSPFSPGQWKYFLLIYSGLWAANNVIRPARFSLSLLISPIFENFIQFFQDKFRMKKTTATALVVFCVNVIGTTSYLVFGLLFATRVARVPLLP